MINARALPEVEMLERFRKAQEPAIQNLLALAAQGRLPKPLEGARPSFFARLKKSGPGAIIAEYKRASPSLGVINLAREPEEIAAAYAKAGATAISVLTEERHFHGDIAFLHRMKEPGIPLLRKDFLLHPLQIVETAATPASALLLIVRMLGASLLRTMLDAARQSGLEAVVEIFDHDDLKIAREAMESTGGAPRILQVNTRDLAALTLCDGLSRELVGKKAGNELWISASGIRDRRDVLERTEDGYDAVLAGTCLMTAEDPGAALAALRGRTVLREDVS
jgi:indole-3-glycerol phosphate synthase